MLYPSNSSVVCTLLNRSENGALLLEKESAFDREKKDSKSQVKRIASVEMVEIFLAVLKNYTEKNEAEFKNEILKVFKNNINEHNAFLLLEQHNLLFWFFNYIKPISVFEVKSFQAPAQTLFEIL